MNRRKALALSMLTGGLLPFAALAQRGSDDLDPPATSSTRGKKVAAKKAKPPRDRELDDEPPADAAEDKNVEETSPPADVKPEAGYTSQTWNITRYTGIAATGSNTNPEAKIIEWIFRRTGSADWHGPKAAILSASRSAIRAYHSPSMLKKVNEVVRCFNKSTADRLAFRVRFVRAADTRWRYLVHSRMTLVGSGPQGQQIWTLNPTDAANVLAQMQQYRGFEVLLDQNYKTINGQTLSVEKSTNFDYTAGVQRDGTAGGAQPAAQQLKEGVTLRMSPLLRYEGDSMELALELRTNVVRRLIKTSILARRDAGANDLQIHVPEVSETRLDQAVENWPLGQTLLISAGVTPGILEPKNGVLGLPGTKPTDRELLVFLDAETIGEAPKSTRRND
jgi:hypothetical protein